MPLRPVLEGTWSVELAAGGAWAALELPVACSYDGGGSSMLLVDLFVL
jgi:hypothetical protein